MAKKLAFILVIFVGLSCDSRSQSFTLYKKGKVIPVVKVNNADLHPLAEDLCDLFEQAAGMRPEIIEGNIPKGNPVIEIGYLKSREAEEYTFLFTQKKSNFIIEGADKKSIYYANRKFFELYTTANQFNFNIKEKKLSEINIPRNLEYKFTPDFEYREPYFPQNFKEQFRHWNMTHTLDEEWGIWGHNINKAIKVTEPMLATINGEVNEEQLCFSSPELKGALTDYIKNQIKENAKQSKYMIMPNDNALVCQCDRCKALGNTEKNASPAVFTLLNSLAKEFSDKQFFSTAYITTQQPPEFKLKENAGVMLSTIAFPKGVVIAQSSKKDFAEKQLSGWKSVTNTIYLWDYAVNFDNYLEVYPTVEIMQQNLQFYKSRGVTGVFMQGSEGTYSSFSDLKSYLYAQLLQDVNVSLERCMNTFFSENYTGVNDLLFDYYTNVERLALESKKAFDIYGGFNQAYDKYIEKSGFDLFYDRLIQRTDTLDVEKNKNLQKLLLGFTFQKLEMLRTKGIAVDGYAEKTAEGNIKIKPVTHSLFERLKKLKVQTGVEEYNESGLKLSDYITYWDEQILNGNYNNLLLNKKIQFLTPLDEDYPNGRMLTDGAVGFSDYYNNWLLISAEAPSIKIYTEDVANASTIKMNFLVDEKHRIYPPKEIRVEINGRQYGAEVVTKEGTYKATAIIPITLKEDDEAIIITIVKQPDYTKRPVACDELYFK